MVPNDVKLVPWTHRRAVLGPTPVTADLRDAQAVAAAFASTSPSLVIHSAVALDVASIVDATRNVVNGASHAGAEVVYISTDAVFSGDGRPVDESARPDPIWEYGRWKAEAEELVLRGQAGSAVVRLPLVVSLSPPDRTVERIRQGAVEFLPTHWFHDETRQPAMAVDVAQAIWRIALLDSRDRSGTWHLPGPERLSRYEIAQRVAAALRLDAGSIVSAKTPPDAVRPPHIDMLGERARSQIGWTPARILI
ncbi:MAG: sugar nucleotide-binding protein [Actinomycetota bacterium]|nr:sugar nucleotide-binding protein [Actinomycetota bacterium]